MAKSYLGIDVLAAAQKRISEIFDDFPRIYLSCSFGKDSTVMTHLVAEEARRRKRKIGMLFVDLEAQYKLTIEHGLALCSMYSDCFDIYWVSLPLHMRNAVSMYEPQWICWDKDKKESWVRPPPDIAITEESYFPFYKYSMEFEEFVPEFGHWYGNGKLTACFVGIRTDESLNRYRSIARKDKVRYEGKSWTTLVYGGKGMLFNAYPIYDWKTDDIWKYHANTGLNYNKLYDRMYQAGLTIHQMRICQPYGDDQRKGLYLFQVIEPETWSKILARVNGANQGALYAKDSGNILGNLKITLPEEHTWESFAYLILGSMPEHTSEHYKDKLAVFIKWWKERGYDPIPDFAEPKDEAGRKVPSWRRICKTLLRNDYWCKGLSFSQHKSDAYHKYKKLMKRRREEWKIMV